MPIQNIDNFLMPNRSQEASIYKSSGESKIPAEQQFLTNEVQNKVERNLTRTHETEKADFGENAFDAKKKGSNEYQYQRKKKKKTDLKKQSDNLEKKHQVEGRMIDIKL